MKSSIAAFLLLLWLHGVDANGGDIKDPTRDYYKNEMSAANDANKLYLFKGAFTDAKYQSIFITDDEAQAERGKYNWTVYYPDPKSPKEYLKARDTVILPLSGSSYIGYVMEIRGFGLLYADRGVVGVQFLSHGGIDHVLLTKDGKTQKDRYEDVYPESYPQYFAKRKANQLTTHTIPRLEKMYP